MLARQAAGVCSGSAGLLLSELLAAEGFAVIPLISHSFQTGSRAFGGVISKNECKAEWQLGSSEPEPILKKKKKKVGLEL